MGGVERKEGKASLKLSSKSRKGRERERKTFSKLENGGRERSWSTGFSFDGPKIEREGKEEKREKKDGRVEKQ